MQVRNLFVNRFHLGPFAVWGADSWEQFTQAKANQLTNQPTEVEYDCPADPTNDCLVKSRRIENSYVKLRIIV